MPSSTNDDPAGPGDEPIESAELADEPVLTPKLDPRLALGKVHVALTAYFALLFVLLNVMPLRQTDLWCHVTYGRWILDHRALPAEDPFCPSTAGVPVLDAVVEKAGGLEWLSNLYAIALLATYLVLARVFYLQSRSPLVTLLGNVMVLLVGWSRIATIRPENFAALLFAVLLWLIVRRECEEERTGSDWPLWLGVPIIFALWANLHGSFVCGLAVLGCYFLGRAVQVGLRTRSLRAVAADVEVRRWFLLGILALAATLVNPYGWRLLEYTAVFGRNPNLRDIVEWQPLAIIGVAGREFALSWVLLVLVLRHSRRPVPVAHGLMLALFTLGVVAMNRMAGWYAAVYTVVVVPHLADILARWRPAAEKGDRSNLPRSGPEGAPHKLDLSPFSDASGPAGEPNEIALPPGRSFIYSLVCLLLIWIAFAVSPISAPVLGREPRTARQLLGFDTPLGVTVYLRANPPKGLVFNPQWWGDWLVWDGPAGLQPFVTSNIHLVPPRTWQDYMHVSQGITGWQQVLDRYGVQTLVVDRDKQPALAAAARRSSAWQVEYEDDQALVLSRAAKPGPTKPTPAPSGTSQ